MSNPRKYPSCHQQGGLDYVRTVHQENWRKDLRWFPVYRNRVGSTGRGDWKVRSSASQIQTLYPARLIFHLSFPRTGKCWPRNWYSTWCLFNCKEDPESCLMLGRSILRPFLNTRQHCRMRNQSGKGNWRWRSQPLKQHCKTWRKARRTSCPTHRTLR